MAGKAKNFVTDLWSVEIGGLVEKPRRLDLAELLKIETEERIYCFRCVEGWSMVIPWVGFPLSRLLELVVPKAEATHVAFETYHDVRQMPDSIYAGIELPYVVKSDIRYPLAFAVAVGILLVYQIVKAAGTGKAKG